MDLKKMSVVELKVLGFDQVKLFEQTREKIQAINKEIERRDGTKNESIAVEEVKIEKNA